jgi:AraC-like DNA-binding protein
MLRDTELAIGDIATVLQYQDANAFSRAFRAWADCSPSDWRDRGRRSAERPR